MHVSRSIVLLTLAALASCSGLVPSPLRMPEFGAQYQPAVHQAATPETTTFILYREPDIDERIKYSVGVMGIEPRVWARFPGYIFDGAFLRITRRPGVWRVTASPTWWEENPPAGESILGRMTPGEPPVQDDADRQITAGVAVLELELRADTVTYLKLARAASDEVVNCGETTQTMELCETRVVEVDFEVVPADTAQADLAELRETIY